MEASKLPHTLWRLNGEHAVRWRAISITGIMLNQLDYAQEALQ
jgi:hypothetical protein